MAVTNPPTQTTLTITLTLNNGDVSKKPTLGATAAAGTSVSITYAATQSGQATGGGKPAPPAQPASPTTPRPTVNIYSGATNIIDFELSQQSGTANKWPGVTYLTAIVVERADPVASLNPGGSGFQVNSSSDTFLADELLGKGSNNPRTGYAASDYNPYSLFSAGTWQLKTVNDQYFQTVAGKESAIQSVFDFRYRLYFYTVGLGTWFDDPLFDMKPTV